MGDVKIEHREILVARVCCLCLSKPRFRNVRCKHLSVDDGPSGYRGWQIVKKAKLGNSCSGVDVGESVIGLAQGHRAGSIRKQKEEDR